MADATNDLLYEVLKSIQQEIRTLKEGQGDIRQEIVSIRLAQLSTQNDVHNIYGMLARQDERLDRIDRRLELRELAEKSQTPYEPPL
ncbi:MAG: hypothetical protein J0I98_15210 [Mesorhizobium sp.]|nr:hypothetical protein [Mesorhizobium sp.]MBN9244138.1 hypothetical protein [Mesorhizobium sp.]MBN9272711.1 hypothetical protein [Mesorhizobium sp.]